MARYSQHPQQVSQFHEQFDLSAVPPMPFQGSNVKHTQDSYIGNLVEDPMMMVKDGDVVNLVEGDSTQTQGSYGKQTQGRDGIDLAEGIVT